MKSLNIKAILAGMIVDIAGSLIVGIIGTILMYVKLISGGLTNEEAVVQLSYVGKNILFTAFSLIAGFGLTVIGGYVAARLAKHDELYNAAFVGVAGVVLALCANPSSAPQWYRMLGLALSIPAAAFGGYIFIRTRAI